LKKISVIGLPTAAVIASRGVDVFENVVNTINEGNILTVKN
jgi:UDP-N-acetyl-D-mannosaminuronate dehydrogenase